MSQAGPTEYQAVFDAADAEAACGRYKEAYNTLARALTIGGPADQECRYKRGLYAYRVAHTRLDELAQSPAPKQTLIKAGCWLARSEAYLLSSSEGVSESRRRAIESDIARTKQEQDRFRRLCRELDIDLFVSMDETTNGE